MNILLYYRELYFDSSPLENFILLTNRLFFFNPTEVARTRLREEGSKYRHFWQTLQLVCKEEGWRGLYRGLGTQLIRQIPNTAIMMSTYEASVYLLNKYLPVPDVSVKSKSFSNDNVISHDDSYDIMYTECSDGSDNHRDA